MSRIDPSTIGQSRPIQDPRQALEANEGRYVDRVMQVPPEQRLPQTPQVNKATPYKITGSIGAGTTLPWPF